MNVCNYSVNAASIINMLIFFQAGHWPTLAVWRGVCILWHSDGTGWWI